MNSKIDISHKTIFFIAGFIAALWVLFQIKEVLLLLFVAIIFMSALSPAVDKLVKWRFPKGLAIALLYIVVVGVIVTLLYLVVTPLVEQTSSLASTLPSTLERLLPPGTVNRNLIEQQVSGIFGNALGFTLTIFSNTVALVSVAVLTFYLLLDKERFEKLLSGFFVHHHQRAKNLTEKIEEKLGAWLRGQLILSLVIGVLSYLLLFFMGIQYALPLAILAGIMEVIPVIGPIISAVPAILIAYVTSATPAPALIVAGGYLFIQQLENHIVVPQVMKRAVGLNPLIVILAIAIGGRLLGIAGALLAVPITVVIQLVLEDFFGSEQNPLG